MKETVTIEVVTEMTDRTKPGLSNVEKKVRKLKTAINETREAMEGLGEAAGSAAAKMTVLISQLSDSARQAEKEIEGAGKAVSQYDRALLKTEKQMKSFGRTLQAIAKERIQIILEVKGDLLPYLVQTKTALTSLSSYTWKVTMKAADLVTAPVQELFRLFSSLQGIVLGGGGTLADSSKLWMKQAEALSQPQEIGVPAAQMENQSQTVNGMLSTICDTFNKTFLQRWGAGLWDGLRPALQRITGWLEENQRTVQEWGYAWEKAGANLSNDITNSFETIREKMSVAMETPEWREADFLGKIEIVWDELIGKPFMDWWQSAGSELIQNALHTIGKGIGSGISMVLSSLFGIDVSGVAGEGASIGGAFVSGVREGLEQDDLGEAFAKTVAGLFKNAGKLLPGGEKADWSSVMSAVLIAKTGMSLIKGGKTVWTLFKSLGAGSTAGASGTGAAGMADLGARILGSAATRTGIKGLLMRLGIIGIRAGTTATSTAGIIASGAGVVTGGLISGATVLSGGMDLYKGYKSQDARESAMYANAGLTKIGKVALGALIGSFILPGIGTAIGAGIGGIFGNMQANEIKEDYNQKIEEEQRAEAEAALKQNKAFMTTGEVVEDVTFGVKELDKAFKDSGVSAEEFAKMYKRAVDDNLESYFGNIKLSMAETRELASNIVLGDNAQSLARYQEATEAAKQRVSELQDTLDNLERMEWKASIGVEISGADKGAYTQKIETSIAQMKQYAEDDLYVGHTIRAMLLDKEGATKYDAADNETYTTKQKEIEALEKQAKELSAKGDIAGTNKHLDKIAVLTGAKDATDPMAQIEKWEKQGLGAMDVDSFSNFTAQAAELIQYADDTYADALAKGLARSGSAEESQALRDGKSQKMAGAEARVMEKLFEALEANYGDKIAPALPEGTDIARTLQSRLYDALAKGENVAEWSPEDVANWLGLEGLDSVILGAIAEIMKQIAQSVPQSTIDTLKDLSGGEDFAPIATALSVQLTSAFTGIDMTPVTTAMLAGISSAYDAVDLSESSKAIRNSAEQALKTELLTPFNAAVQVNLNAKTRWFGLGSPGLPTVPKPEPPIGYIDYRARGGFVSGKRLSWIGEEGPEAIIPLVPSRRQRAIDLYEQTGRMLGIGRHAEGGIIGAAAGMKSGTSLAADNVIQLYPHGIDLQPYKSVQESSEGYSVGSNSVSVSAGTGGGNNITVEVHLTQQFDINATDRSEQELKRMIKNTVSDMTDDLGVALAEKVTEAFGNMPKAKIV